MSEPTKKPDNPKLLRSESATFESASIFSKEDVALGQEVKQLWGWYLYVILFIIFSLAIFMPAIGMANVLGFLDDWDLHEVGHDLKAFLLTESKPTLSAETWCDSMLEMGDEYYSIKRYEKQKSDFPYTLNKHVLGLESIPDNMIVLFKANPGWNQVGDVESVRNQERLLVFLWDGTRSTFRKREIPYLRWKFEDTGVIPPPDNKLQLTIMSVSLGAVFLVTFLALRKYVMTYCVLAIWTGVASAAIGAWFGFMAEGAYYKLGTTGNYTAPLTGSVWGFVAGVAFIAIIGRIFSKYKSNVSMVGYATVIGAITGILASSIVHGYLMIGYQEKSFSYMLGGSCFGIMAGLLLGWISSGLIRLYNSNREISEPDEDLAK